MSISPMKNSIRRQDDRCRTGDWHYSSQARRDWKASRNAKSKAQK